MPTCSGWWRLAARTMSRASGGPLRCAWIRTAATTGDRLALIDELSAGPNIPDGTVKDALRMARGYWEAKDTHDDLDAEIQAKFNRGYPQRQHRLRGLGDCGAVPERRPWPCAWT